MDELRLKELKDKASIKDLEALFELIEYYEDQNDYEALIPLYLLVLEDNEKDMNALNNLAMIYTDQVKDFAKARYYYEKLMDLQPHQATYLFNYASFLEFDLQDYVQAKEYYIKTIELDHEYIDAYLNLSWLYIEQFKDINTSYIVVQEALKYVENSEIYCQLGFIEYSKYGDYQKAIETLKKAIEIDDQNDLAYTYLGEIYKLKKDFEEAKYYFNQAVNTNKVNELLIHEYGRLLLIHYKDFNKTIELLEKAVQQYPDSALYQCYLANIYFVTGNVKKAKEYLNQAETHEISDQESLLMVGYLKVMLDDNKEDAILYFEKVIELNPKNLNALSFIGFYNLFHNQHIDTALEHFKKIAELSDDYFIINFIIAQIYLQYYQDSSSALEYLLKIDTKELPVNDLAHLYYIIGSIYEKNEDDNNKALDYYEKAYAASPSKSLEDIINTLYEKDKTLVN